MATKTQRLQEQNTIVVSLRLRGKYVKSNFLLGFFIYPKLKITYANDFKFLINPSMPAAFISFCKLVASLLFGNAPTMTL